MADTAQPAPTFACCALAAGAGVLAVDLSLLLAADGPLALLGVCAAVVGLAAALLAAGARLGFGLARRARGGPWRRSLVGAALALVVIVPVSALLFRGTGIRSMWYASFGPFVVAPLLFGLVAVGLRLAGAVATRVEDRLPRRLALTPAGLLFFGLLTWADRQLYPNQYDYLHWVLLLCGAITLMASAWLLLPRRASRARRVCPVLLVAALPAAVAAAVAMPGTNRARALLAERTHAAGRLVAAARGMLDRDGDGHSVIFGERDCDNADPSVHPLALDVPGNGLDEDCDGTDAQPIHERPADPEKLDVTGYRKRLAAWRTAPPLADRLARTGNLSWLLIVLDDLRQDQVSPTPANHTNHPRLMRLLAGCRRFGRAFSAGAGTDIGMATILTGQLDPFAPDNPTLFQLFGRAGYRTHGVFQREVDRWLGRQFSLRGLQSRRIVVNDPWRRDKGTHATAGQVTDAGIRFLERHGGERFLLWLHYFDIHEHHQIEPRTLGDPAARDIPRGKPFYRRLIRHVDGHLGRLLDALDRLDLSRRIGVVVLADHGEGLGDHPRLPEYHGDLLYNPLVHVPLAFRLPGVEPRLLHEPVSLADLTPTLLDLAGIEAPPTHGVSLVPYLLDAHLDELRGFSRPLFLMETKQQAVIRWPWKLLRRLDQGLVELYHLGRDFAESHNLADDRPDLTRELATLLAAQHLITIDRLKKRPGTR